jgi:hypothetical protein
MVRKMLKRIADIGDQPPDGEGIVSWRHVSPPNVNPGADGILNALEALELA